MCEWVMCFMAAAFIVFIPIVLFNCNEWLTNPKNNPSLFPVSCHVPCIRVGILVRGVHAPCTKVEGGSSRSDGG